MLGKGGLEREGKISDRGGMISARLGKATDYEVSITKGLNFFETVLGHEGIEGCKDCVDVLDELERGEGIAEGGEPDQIEEEEADFAESSSGGLVVVLELLNEVGGKQAREKPIGWGGGGIAGVMGGGCRLG